LKEVERLEIGDEQGLTQAEVLRLSRQGETLLQQGRAAAAEQLFRDLLARLEAGAAYDAAYDLSTTSMRLGRCLAAQGQPTRAIEWHRRALQGFEQLGESSEVAKSQVGYVHADLADNLAAIGQFDDAQNH
jgi:tetratricopeptide (TPR) repeat protein